MARICGFEAPHNWHRLLHSEEAHLQQSESFQHLHFSSEVPLSSGDYLATCALRQYDYSKQH